MRGREHSKALRSTLRRLAALVVVGLFPSSLAAAHDYWIEPGTWTPEVGSVLAVRHLVGHAHELDEVPRSEARIERFVCLQEGEVRPIVGRDGEVPAGFVRLVSEGLHHVAYESRPVFLELPPERFRAYLFEESLGRIVTERQRRGEQESPGRELYSRCAKSIVRVGSSSSGSPTRPTGLTLEIVPLADPTRPSADAPFELPLELRFQGQPLAGARLRATPLGSAGHAHPQAVTDDDGRATLVLPDAGAWVLTNVHMERAAPNEEGADWRSWWASLSFSIPEDGGEGGGAHAARD